tara:strand:+ start:187 stop:1023 length:837 start_codon:yes stop_codon:yes gene_type:complete
MGSSFQAGNAGMPLYLLIAAVFNVCFVYRSAKDTYVANGPLAKQPAIALLVASLSELCWVLPCMVQCAIVFFAGNDGGWSPQSKTGCDVMGFYSQFGSLCSMMATVLVGYLSYCAAHRVPLPSVRVTKLAAVGVFAFALLISILPLTGATGSYANSGEGFCYIDWSDEPQAVLMLLISISAIVASVTLYGLAARGVWEKKLDLLLLVLGFLSAWVLWPPAAVIGLADGTFPKYYMITGAILGHAQALINPYIYGIRWRTAMLTGGSYANDVEKQLSVS